MDKNLDQSYQMRTGSLLSLISTDSYRTYNLHLAKILGSVNASIMLGELVQRYQYHHENNELIYCSKLEGSWFYYTHEKCEERTALSRREQDNALNILEKHEIIKKKIIGVPGKRHFQINEEKIIELLNNSKKDYSLAESAKLDWRKTPNWIGGKRQTIKDNQEDNQEETTNYLGETEEENQQDQQVVSSFSFEKVQELEMLKLKESEKATLYKKFTREQILKGIKSIKPEKAKCLFALLHTAIQNEYEPNDIKDEKYKEAILVYQKALDFLSKIKNTSFSLDKDENSVYFHRGNGITKINLTDEDFKEKFVKTINQMVKDQ